MSRLVRRFSLSRVRERAGVRARACAVTMAFVCALYPVSYTAAQGSAETTIGFKQGKVMARQLVLGPNGKPIFAEFDQAGEVAQEIGEATEENRLQGALVIAGSVYRGMVASYDDLKRRYNDAVMMSRAQYEASTFALSQDRNATLERPPLASQVKTVLIRVSGTVPGTPSLTLVPAQEFLLDTYPMALPPARINNDTMAVLISSEGLIRHASPNNIGFRTAWISDNTGDVTRDNDATRQSTEKPLGPIQGALVSAGLGSSMDITGSDGAYSIQYWVPPCPGSSYSAENRVMAELRTQNFNPRGTYTSTYVVQAPLYMTCYGGYAGLAAGSSLGATSVYQNSEAMLGTQSNYNLPLDIKVDVMSLAGQGVLSNDATLNRAIPVANETTYSAAAMAFNPFNPSFLDLNGDGNADRTFLCGQNVKVYFDAPPADQDPCTAQADVTRLADRPADYTDQGLLRSITKEDLEQTDLYVFRVSNGRLISERKGLKPPTAEYQGSGVGKNTDGSASNQFFYNMLLRGPRDVGATNETLTLSFTEWQTKSAIKDPALLERKGDHLRVGEQLKIIAINRVTGYIGSVVTTLQNAAGNQSGALRIGADKIVLRPPNLRIKAERTSIVEAGLTKGEQRNFLIGFEGSALKSDKVIALSTEWVDADGSPLPDGLPGYTGRLAKVVDGRRLGGLPPRNDLAEFEVKPGKRVQLIALPDDVAVSNDHFYVHVCAARYSDRTECAEHYTQNLQLSASNPLHYRPKHYVPVRVPLYDEALTELTKVQLRKSLSTAEDPAERQPWLDALRNADPNYRWPYRPEMQFSVYELTSRGLRSATDNGEVVEMALPTDITKQVMDALLGENINTVDLLYDLVGAPFTALPSIGPPRELIFALGAEEVMAMLGTNKEAHFTNLSHLGKLGPSDLLTLRLLQNSDAANVLWEYAFPVLEVAVDLNRDGKLTFDTDLFLPRTTATEPDKPTDKTTPTRPYRFWINNDLDVVNDSGVVKLTEPTCIGNVIQSEAESFQQVCEQWDEDPAEQTNTSDANITRIESYRDLEDFAPLKIRLGHNRINPNYYLKLRAVGVGVNVFYGVWRDDGDQVAHEYIFNEAITREQVTSPKVQTGHWTVRRGGEANITASEISRYFDTDGVGRFIFEGITASALECSENAANCYLLVELYNGSSQEPLISRKVYLDLHDVKDFYEQITAGTAEPAGQPAADTSSFEARYSYGAIGPEHTRRIDIYSKVAPEAVITSDYVLLVHGWRMRDSEKIDFAQTSFKRLYWSGYQGRFGALSWPTGWFYKPAHEYSTAAAIRRIAGNQQNYSNSEAVARLVGVQFAQWLRTSGVTASHGNLHLVAHSMGNVVVSEALRHGEDLDVTSYAASQAAEVAGAYDANVVNLRHRLWGTALSCDRDRLHGPEEAWRCYNADGRADPFDMPPDKYRYTIPAIHGPTTDENVASLSVGPAYYFGLVGPTLRTVNFYNPPDAALSVWEFQQLTKPDRNSGPEWSFNADTCATCSPTERSDRFERGGTALTWSGAVPLTEDDGNILAHIIPARTHAMGQTQGVLSTDVFLNGFTNSNQDHSGQFHGYLSETRRGVAGARAQYWVQLLDQSVQPVAYSGLIPAVPTAR